MHGQKAAPHSLAREICLSNYSFKGSQIDPIDRQVDFGFGTSYHYLEAADPLRNGTPYSTALYFM
eukprot:scaffold127550_cov40-Prasinocladus_malaysianus.AAC.1